VERTPARACRQARGQLARQWAPRALELHGSIKRVFDPKGLLNPEKKIAD